MHRALEIPEIILNIFSYCDSDPSDLTWSYYRGRDKFSHLLALARTCRAFKEPALDLLWRKLPHLCPLARCIPGASRGSKYSTERYWFRRPLTSAEWDILRSYASRTRSIHLLNSRAVGLCRRILISLSKPPMTEPLFSNVRYLCMDYAHNTKSLILLPFPSLISLDIQLQTTRFLENFLRSLAKTSPNLKTLSISPISHYGVDMKHIEPSFICRWQNLQIVDCHEIILGVNTLLLLSRMSSLTRLDFTLDNTVPDQISPSDLPLLLPTLDEFSTFSESLSTVSRFISQSRFPAVKSVSVVTRYLPSRQDLSIFFATVRTSSSACGVRKLLLKSHHYVSTPIGEQPILGFQDLAPCMEFGHLRAIDINIKWRQVDLTDGELLLLASAWPQLEVLFINKEYGWETSGGITPDGILLLLQTCPSLTQFALAMDTRGYTTVPSSPAIPGLAAGRVSSVDVVDSTIEDQSVLAVGAFFSGIVRPADFSFTVLGTGWGTRWGRERMYSKGWMEVDNQCRQMVASRKTSDLRWSGKKT